MATELGFGFSPTYVAVSATHNATKKAVKDGLLFTDWMPA